MKTTHTFKHIAFLSVAIPTLMLSGCGDLAFVKPTDNQMITTPVTTGTLTVKVPIVIDFTASTRARNIVLDNTLNITTAPNAHFSTAPGAGQQNWDRVSGEYELDGGVHTLTARAEYKDFANATKTISKTVTFTVLGPLPDLNASITSNKETFNGSSNVEFQVFIRNSGPAAANNVTLSFFTNMPAGMNTLNINGGFTCRGLSGFGQALQVECSGGNIAGYQSAYMTVTVKPTNILPIGTPFTLYGYLDHPNPTIAESDESNNAFTKAVIVGP